MPRPSRKRVRTKRIRITTVKEVNWAKVVADRSGVIPFTIQDRELYFCLGIDRKTSDLTDFAGQRKATDPSSLWTGIREFREESKGAFGNLYSESKFQDAKCLLPSWRINHVTFFLEVPLETAQRTRELFTHAVKEQDEMLALVWIPAKDFWDLIFSRESKLYSVVKNFLQSFGNHRILLESLGLQGRIKKTSKQRKY